MCGLPAAGKTTTAAWLHARAGGTLIRSCDVFAALGISVADWVERTRGFAVGASDYEALRDRAYLEMARRLEAALAAGRDPVIVDAAHVERAKRQAVYEICRRHGARPAVVWCRCDDAAEIARRLERRCGREREPEHEASDVSVLRHLAGLWEDPRDDRLSGGAPVDIVVWDTARGDVTGGTATGADVLDLVRGVLGTGAPAGAP
jgi:predicted kinase